MLEQMAAMKIQEETKEAKSRQEEANDPSSTVQMPREGQNQKSMV
jgi:hypothetical protein